MLCKNLYSFLPILPNLREIFSKTKTLLTKTNYELIALTIVKQLTGLFLS